MTPRRQNPDPWAPKGDLKFFQEAINILGPLPEVSSETKLSRIGAEQQIQWIARTLNSDIYAEDHTPSLGAAITALQNISDATLALHHAMTSPASEGAWLLLQKFQRPKQDSEEEKLWEAARAYELPFPGGFAGGVVMPGQWVPEIKALAEWLENANVEVSSLTRQGRGSYITRLSGSVNEELVFRCAVILEACEKPHGATKYGNLHRLAVAIKAYATGLKVGESAMGKDVEAVGRTTPPKEIKAWSQRLLKADKERGNA